MQRTRSRLSWIAAGWLLVQLVGVGAGLLGVPAAQLTQEVGVRCTCPTGTAGQTCPMHHGGENAEDTTDCRLRTPCAPTDAALLSLLYGIGVEASRADVHVNLVATMLPVVAIDAATRVELPESPPPRG